LTLLLAKACAPVRVNAVAPGLIDTPWTAGFDAVRRQVEAEAPLARSGRPDEIAEAIVSLVTNSYVTGEIMVVDGGVDLVR
jgi:ketoreductase RED2